MKRMLWVDDVASPFPPVSEIANGIVASGCCHNLPFFMMEIQIVQKSSTLTSLVVFTVFPQRSFGGRTDTATTKTHLLVERKKMSHFGENRGRSAHTTFDFQCLPPPPSTL